MRCGFLLYIGCCVVFGFVMRCVRAVVCSWLLIVGGCLFVACSLSCVVCRLWFFGSLFVVCCVFVVCLLCVGFGASCLLRVDCCALCDVCCWLYDVCCLLNVACRVALAVCGLLR